MRKLQILRRLKTGRSIEEKMQVNVGTSEYMCYGSRCLEFNEKFDQAGIGSNLFEIYQYMWFGVSGI